MPRRSSEARGSVRISSRENSEACAVGGYQGAPDKGGRDSAKAWVAACGGLLALFVAFGLAYSYGVFFDSITAEFGAGSGAGAAVFSITSLLFFGLSAVTGPVADRVGPRKVLIVGAIVLGLGLVGTSVSGALWQAYLAYGLGVGIGVGCVYVPVIVAVGKWFERKRSLALGITVSGIGLGTLVVAPLSAWLIGAYGWREVYAGYAIAGLVLLLVAATLFPAPPESTSAQEDSAQSRWGGRRYAQLYLGTLLLNVALYVPFVHLPPAAQEAGVRPVAAAGLVGVVGISSVVGRLLIGGVGDRVRLLALYKGCFLLIALSFILWTLAGGYSAFVVFAITLGVGYGGYIALTPAVLAALFGLEGLGRLLGVIYTAVGLGAALGPSLVGISVDATGSYTGALIGLTLAGLLGTAVMLPMSEKEAK